MTKDELIRKIEQVYRTDTGIKLCESEKEKLAASILLSPEQGGFLEDFDEFDFWYCLNEYEIDVQGKKCTGILSQVNNSGVGPARQVIPIPIETMTLTEFARAHKKFTDREGLKLASERKVQLLVHFAGDVELLCEDPEDGEAVISGLASFNGLVFLNQEDANLLDLKGIAHIGDIIEFNGGVFIYRGQPIPVTLEHVRVMKTDVVKGDDEEFVGKADFKWAEEVEKAWLLLGESEIDRSRGRNGGSKSRTWRKLKEQKSKMSEHTFDRAWRLFLKLREAQK